MLRGARVARDDDPSHLATLIPKPQLFALGSILLMLYAVFFSRFHELFWRVLP